MKYKDHKIEILDEMIASLSALPSGAETTIVELLSMLYSEDKELMENVFLSYEPLSDLEKIAKKNGIYIDTSKHDGKMEGLPGALDFAVYHKKPGKKCPYCGHRDTAKIMYGCPVFSEELKADIDNHRILLGGCCITPMSPKYYCFGCKKGFGKPPVFHSKLDVESYEEAVTEITFERGGFFQGWHSVTVKADSEKYVVSIRDFGKKEERFEFSEKAWRKLIKRLYYTLFIHEWKKRYDDLDILDGEQWSLEIKLTGKRVRNIYGSNDYPPYWNELVRTFKDIEKNARESQ